LIAQKLADIEHNSIPSDKSRQLASDIQHLLIGRRPRLFAAFLAILLLIGAVQLPTLLSFDFFAFGDCGSNLSLYWLLSHSYLPGRDFGYHYGPLALLMNWGWFRLFGCSPFSYVGATVVFWVAIARAFTVIADDIEPVGILLMTVSLPIVLTGYSNFAHGLEAALLTNSLAEQSAQRCRSAFVLGLLAYLTKPALAAVYIVILACELILPVGPSRNRLTRRSILSGALYVLGCGVLAIFISSLAFGIAQTLSLILPLAGIRSYKDLGFGLFGRGKYFWHPLHPRLAYYLLTPAGFWMLGTVYVVLAAAYVIYRTASNRSVGAGDALLLTCGVLQLAFVTFLFGGPFSPFYYIYLIPVGVAASCSLGRAAQCVAFILVCFGALSITSPIQRDLQAWTFTAPYQRSLWMSKTEHLELDRVLEVTAGKSTAVLSQTGCFPLLFPSVRANVNGFLVIGISPDAAIRRKVVELSKISMVILGPDSVPKGWFPSIDKVLSDFALLYKGSHLKVLLRKDSSGGLHTATKPISGTIERE
jgi:hypothetical protein